MLFTDLPLDHRILKFLRHQSLSAPTDIQQQAIPHALLGNDLIAQSKTGSGKTFAYLLPAVHRVLKQRALSPKDPRVLILAPTRELAKQVFNELRKVCSGIGLKYALVIGGENFNDQCKALRKNPHFVVGTAGRVADHLTDKSLYLNGLEMLILDEADRMLDLGFSSQLKHINQAANHRKRQTLMFSATLDNAEMSVLSRQLLKAPRKITIDEANAQHQDIQQAFYFADNIEHKQALLLNLLKIDDSQQAIIFVATREHAQSLADFLEKEKISSIGLSAQLTQGQRNTIMQGFSRNKYQVLVTTDVASRGLDISNVALVFNFDLPKLADEYVHRIGRTGRAGSQGRGISLVGPNDWKSFLQLKQFLRQDITFSTVDELPARFSGFAKKNTTKKVVSHKKNKKTQPVSDKKPVKRVKTWAGIEVGDIPLRKKSKPNS